MPIYSVPTLNLFGGTMKVLTDGVTLHRTYPLSMSGNEITDATRTANVQGDGRTAPDKSVGIWPAGGNQILNGGFETNLANTTATNARITRITTDHKFGSACCEWQALASAPTQLFFWANGGVVPVSGATTGRRLVYSNWIRGVGNSIGKPWRLEVNEVGGATPEELIAYSDYTLTGAWQRLWVGGAMVRNDRTHFGLYSVPLNPLSGDTIRIDGVQAELDVYFPSPYIHTDGTTAGRAGNALVLVNPGLLSLGQGWIAFRARPGFSNAVHAGETHKNFSYLQRDVNNSARVYFEPSNGQLAVEYRAGAGIATYATVNATHNIGDTITLIGRWIPGQPGISLNGGAFSNVSLAFSPVLPATQLEIGSLNGVSHFNGDFLWIAFGNGTLTDADAATIHGFGNAKKVPSDFPVSAQCSAVWQCADSDMAVTRIT